MNTQGVCQFKPLSNPPAVIAYEFQNVTGTSQAPVTAIVPPVGGDARAVSTTVGGSNRTSPTVPHQTSGVYHVPQAKVATTPHSPIPTSVVSYQVANTEPDLSSTPTHLVPTQNTHSMRTRSKASDFKPKVYLEHTEPTSLHDALTHPVWLAAMKEEYTALIRNKTCKLVQLPPNRRVIGCNWVFKVKHHSDGTVSIYKARLVAKDFHQQPRFDYNETFSPVVKPTTVRIILSLALAKGWSLGQLDDNAFPNQHLKEEVYMVQPPRFQTDEKTLVCKLQSSLWAQSRPLGVVQQTCSNLVQIWLHTK